MLLAMRTTPATDARWIDKLAHWLIKARLVTRYPHAGIVIGDTLYHSTAKQGPHKTTEWHPERWVLVDVGGDDQKAIDAFESIIVEPDGWFRRLVRKITKGYDFASLLSFVGVPVRDSRSVYCFELCWLMMTGKHPTERVTLETLLVLAARQGAAHAD